MELIKDPGATGVGAAPRRRQEPVDGISRRGNAEGDKERRAAATVGDDAVAASGARRRRSAARRRAGSLAVFKLALGEDRALNELAQQPLLRARGERRCRAAFGGEIDAADELRRTVGECRDCITKAGPRVLGPGGSGNPGLGRAW